MPVSTWQLWILGQPLPGLVTLDRSLSTFGLSFLRDVKGWDRWVATLPGLGLWAAQSWACCWGRGVFSSGHVANLALEWDVGVILSWCHVAPVGGTCADEWRNEWVSPGVRENFPNTFSCAPSGSEGVITGLAALGGHPSWKPLPRELVSPQPMTPHWEGDLCWPPGLLRDLQLCKALCRHWFQPPKKRGGAGIQGHRVGKGWL